MSRWRATLDVVKGEEFHTTICVLKLRFHGTVRWARVERLNCNGH